jgi:hypothetical protein
MSAPTLTWKQIVRLRPCNLSRSAAHKQLKALFPDIDKRALTLADAAAAGVDFDGLIWIVGRASKKDPDCARRMHLFGADCAARVAHIANDPRSTAAIVAARGFARGAVTEEQRGDAYVAAWKAAWGSAKDATAAKDAAYAAAYAASYAAVVTIAGTASASAGSARDAEQSWQRDRLVAWFSDSEPEDWPITEKQAVAA